MRQSNILQIVQQHVALTLTKGGARYKGLCPFHLEKTPSFYVNPEKDFFHCFGCGAGGDSGTFLELIKRGNNDEEAHETTE